MSIIYNGEIGLVFGEKLIPRENSMKREEMITLLGLVIFWVLGLESVKIYLGNDLFLSWFKYLSQF